MRYTQAGRLQHVPILVVKDWHDSSECCPGLGHLRYLYFLDSLNFLTRVSSLTWKDLWTKGHGPQETDEQHSPCDSLIWSHEHLYDHIFNRGHSRERLLSLFKVIQAEALCLCQTLLHSVKRSLEMSLTWPNVFDLAESLLSHWLVWMEETQGSCLVRSEQADDKVLIERGQHLNLKMLTSRQPGVSASHTVFFLSFSAAVCSYGVCFNGGHCREGSTQLCECLAGFNGPSCQYGE